MKLNEWRREAGLTQAEVASMLDVHVLTISSWERGAKRPTPKMINEIHRITGGAVQPNDFHTLPALTREAA
jgi:transcriptional regulator with XRE-family HTH domain